MTEFLQPKHFIRALETGETIDIDCTLWSNNIGEDKTYTSVPFYKNTINFFYNKRSIAANKIPLNQSTQKVVGMLEEASYFAAFSIEKPETLQLIKMLSRIDTTPYWLTLSQSSILEYKIHQQIKNLITGRYYTALPVKLSQK